MIRSACAVAWLVVCFSSTLPAQSPGSAADSADVLVLDHDFTTTGEVVRVFLYDMQVYRAELSTEDVSLQIRARSNSGTKTLRVYPIFGSRSSGVTVAEIYPDQDGEYEIRPVSLQGSRTSTRLRLYRDVSESRRRLTAMSRPRWEIGVELGGGWHSGFVQSNVAPPIGSEPSAGKDIELCLTARSAPKSQRFGMCVLGVSHQSQNRAPSVMWVYTEPRLGILLGRDQYGYSSWEAGPLFRFGVGIDASSSTARTFAPGVFLARHIRTSKAAAGWTLQLSYHRAFFHGFTTAGTGDPVTPKSHRVSLGIGWYR
jgi:hypothetical protein